LSRRRRSSTPSNKGSKQQKVIGKVWQNNRRLENIVKQSLRTWESFTSSGLKLESPETYALMSSGNGLQLSRSLYQATPEPEITEASEASYLGKGEKELD